MTDNPTSVMIRDIMVWCKKVNQPYSVSVDKSYAYKCAKKVGREGKYSRETQEPFFTHILHAPHPAIIDVAPDAVKCGIQPNTVTRIIAPILQGTNKISPKDVLDASTLHDETLRPQVHTVLCDLYRSHPNYFKSDPATVNRPELEIYFEDDKDGNPTDKVDIEPTYEMFEKHFKVKATTKGAKIELRINKDWSNLYYKLKIGKPQTMLLLRRFLSSAYDGKLKPKYTKQLADWIVERAPEVLEEEWDPNPNYINCGNGILDITGITDITKQQPKLIPHSEITYLSRMQVPNYRPDAPIPELYLKTLDEIYSGNKIKIHKTIDAHSQLCTPNLHGEKVYCFVSTQGTGKSTIIIIGEALIGGREFLSRETFHHLGGKFGTSTLQGKYANIVLDTNTDGNVQATNNIKTMTSKEGFQAERKGEDQDETDTTPPLRTLAMFGMNKLPHFPDLDDTGIAIRFEIIPLHNTFRDTERDNKNLKNELTTQDQLDSIFTHVLLPRIIENRTRGKLKYNLTETEAMENFSTHTYNMSKFSDLYCIIDENLEVSVSEFRKYYEAFCRKNMIEAQSPQKINKWFTVLGVERIQINRTGEKNRPEYWRGIGLNPETKKELIPNEDNVEQEKIVTPTVWPSNKPTREKLYRESNGMQIPNSVTRIIEDGIFDRLDKAEITEKANNTWKEKHKDTHHVNSRGSIDLLLDWFFNSEAS